MQPSSRTPEGQPNRCSVCHHEVRIEPSLPPGDAPCPYCGHLLWFGRVRAIEDLPFVLRSETICEMYVLTREEAVETLVSRLSQLGELPRVVVPEVITSVMRREELGSTAIGRGIAIPHAEHPSVRKLVGIIGHIADGIDFNSLDGEDVKTVVLLLSPSGDTGNRLRAMEQISRVLRVSAYPKQSEQPPA